MVETTSAIPTAKREAKCRRKTIYWRNAVGDELDGSKRLESGLMGGSNEVN